MDDEVRTLVMQKADAATIRRTCTARGMTLLRQNGAERILQGETTVDQPEGNIDVLAKISENEGSECEDVRVVRADPECLSSKVDTGPPGRFRVFDPASHLELMVTMSRQGESRAVLRIAFYRLPEQVERPKDAALLE